MVERWPHSVGGVGAVGQGGASLGAWIGSGLSLQAILTAAIYRARSRFWFARQAAGRVRVSAQLI